MNFGQQIILACLVGQCFQLLDDILRPFFDQFLTLTIQILKLSFLDVFRLQIHRFQINNLLRIQCYVISMTVYLISLQFLVACNLFLYSLCSILGSLHNQLIIIILFTMNQILDSSYFKNTIKDKYSFPKTQRFPQLKSGYTVDYFQSSSIQKPRSTSFGFGSKYDFFKDCKKGPSPFEYSVKNVNQQHVGMSFGHGRQEIKANSYIDYQKTKTPKANEYNADVLKLKKKQPSCYIFGRNPLDSFIKVDKNPGPTKYDPIDTYYSRRRKSSQFGFGSAKRFNYENPSINRMTGPGSYALSPKNQSKYGTIGHATRKTFAVQQIEKSITPGPKYILK